MNDDAENIISVLDKVKDDASIKNGQSSMDEAAWKTNQFLCTSSLNSVTSTQFRDIYMRVVTRYLKSRESAKTVDKISVKVPDVENKAVGGTWL